MFIYTSLSLKKGASSAGDVITRSGLNEPTEPCIIAAKAYRQPILVGGRYLKLVRGVSQSPWLVPETNDTKTCTSVEVCTAEQIGYTQRNLRVLCSRWRSTESDFFDLYVEMSHV